MILRNNHNLIECLECVGGVSNILSANVLLSVVNFLNLNIKKHYSPYIPYPTCKENLFQSQQ